MLLAGWWIFFGEMAKEFRDSSTKAGGEFGQNEGFKHEHGGWNLNMCRLTIKNGGLSWFIMV